MVGACDKPAQPAPTEQGPTLPEPPSIIEGKPLEPGTAIPLGSNDPKERKEAEEEALPPEAISDVILAGMHDQAKRFAGGMVVATRMFRGSLVNGATQDFQAILQPAHCFKIVGVGGPTVKDLDLLLFDPNGVQVQQDTATDSYPVLGLHQPICPTSPGAYRVQVRMYKGAGDFGVQVFHSR